MKRTVSAFLIFMLLFFLVIFSSARECEEQMPPSVGAFLQNNFKGWRQIGPEGGSIIGLASDPGNPKKIFAATQFGLIYQSLDSGCNWKRISFLNEILFDFKIAPSTPLSFFALAENRICISQDGGSNWEIFSFGSNFRALQGKIVAHPHNPSILYITGQVNERLSVLKSIDGGRLWEEKEIWSEENHRVFDISLSSLNPDVICVVGDVDNCLFKSTDAGNTWNKIPLISQKYPWASIQPNAILISPFDASTIFIGTDWAIFRSRDGGVSWDENINADAQLMVADPSDPQTIYAAGFEKFYKSMDAGLSWEAYSKGFFGANHSLLTSSRHLLLGNDKGILKSSDGGILWKDSHKNITAQNILSFHAAPSLPNTLYCFLDEIAGYSSRELWRSPAFFRSFNSGKDWEKPENYLQDFDNTLAVDPKNSDILYTAVNASKLKHRKGNIYKSNDGGDFWSLIFSRNDFFIEDIVVSRRNHEHIYVASAGVFVGADNFFFKSWDGGKTWDTFAVMETFENWEDTRLALDPKNDENIYLWGRGDDINLGMNCGFLYKSSDGGTSWELVGDGISHNINEIKVDPVQTRNVFAGTRAGIFKSKDVGLSWGRRASFPVNSIVMSPVFPNIIFAGGETGVFFSSDNGDTWSDFTLGIYVTCLDLDMNNGFLYAGTRGGSVLRMFLSDYMRLELDTGPGGTTDPEPGVYTYSKGTKLKIAAIVDPGYRFDHWSGDLSGTINPRNITLKANKYIKAHFTRQNTLSLEAEEGGTTDPAPGIYAYDQGSTISITALPLSHFIFLNWSGDVGGTENPETISMNSDKNIQANFIRTIYAPASFHGEKKEVRFLFYNEYINELSWQRNPDNDSISKYRIYLSSEGNKTLIVEIEAGTFTYRHRPVDKDLTYNYVLVAVDINGREGQSAFATVR